jgi:hypothetical protein
MKIILLGVLCTFNFIIEGWGKTFPLSSKNSQNTTFVIRGRVVDAQSKFPILGASVKLLENQKGCMTDTAGKFVLSNCPLGRISLQVSSVGYKNQSLNNLVVTAGKELILTVELEENVQALTEVKVSGVGKEKQNGESAFVSARTLLMSDTRRFAGSRNDPARMVTGLAGVVSNNDFRNDIVVRGATPNGILWQLEGISIPNPNHFGNNGGTGGPVSMLNNNVLDKSDFLTGAFPAQYGNAQSGVFDLRMRNGNSDKREYVAQIGLNGFEFGAEGGIGKKGASFLANYRYSVLDVMNKLGISAGVGVAVPRYQDLNFKLHFPFNVANSINIFGLFGKSGIDISPESLDKNNTQNIVPLGVRNASNTSIIGLQWKHYLSMRTSTIFTLTYSNVHENTSTDSLNIKQNEFQNSYNNDLSESRLTGMFQFRHKFSSQNDIGLGLTYIQNGFQLEDSVRFVNQGQGFNILHKNLNKTSQIQSYAFWQHRFNREFSSHLGFHVESLNIIQKPSFEPRFGLKYRLSDTETLSFGAGVYSQIQNFQTYFFEVKTPDGKSNLVNKNLDFTKSLQFVLSLNVKFKSDWQLKYELYYQQIFNVPVAIKPSYYSTLNLGAGYGLILQDSLLNAGTGQNTGIEFTLERQFHKNWYLLSTLSLYKSVYKGSNGIEKNTAFNGNFAMNGLVGREFNITKNKMLSVDLKVTYAGGRRFVPVNTELSKKSGTTIYDVDKSYDESFKNYFRFDAKVGYRLNRAKLTHEFSFDVQNVFNTQNIFTQTYDTRTAQVNTQYQYGIFPIINYRLTF